MHQENAPERKIGWVIHFSAKEQEQELEQAMIFSRKGHALETHKNLAGQAAFNPEIEEVNKIMVVPIEDNKMIMMMKRTTLNM